MPVRRVVARAATLTAVCVCASTPQIASADAQADPLVAQTWQLQGDGPMGIGSAWQRTTGGDVVVAVLDSGADLTHPDLAPNLWTNPDELAGNGIDDDDDGYVDDVHGADVLHSDGDPSDDNGHGTHVAGIIGAVGGNAIGSAGIAWRVRVMPIKVLDARATGDSETVALGLRYAVAHGARIVNLSLAGPRRSQALRDAVELARAAGVLVVAAAGNAGQDLGVTPSYPVSLPQPNVVGVAATRQDGALVGASNRGAGVELAAPGADILSTARGGGYELRTGTSVAAPMVAGAAALLASASPKADFRTLSAALVGGARATVLAGGERQLDVGGALRFAATAPVDRSLLSRYAAEPRTLTGTTKRARTAARARAVAQARAAAVSARRSAASALRRSVGRTP